MDIRTHAIIDLLGEDVSYVYSEENGLVLDGIVELPSDEEIDKKIKELEQRELEEFISSKVNSLLNYELKQQQIDPTHTVVTANSNNLIALNAKKTLKHMEKRIKKIIKLKKKYSNSVLDDETKKEIRKEIFKEEVKTFEDNKKEILEDILEMARLQTKLVPYYLNEGKGSPEDLLRYKVKEAAARKAVMSNDYSYFINTANNLSRLNKVKVTPEEVAKSIIARADEYSIKFEHYVKLIEDFRTIVTIKTKEAKTEEELQAVRKILKLSEQFTYETTEEEVKDLINKLIEGTL